MSFLKINYIALKTIFVHEMIRFMRIWPQTILPSVITMSLYFIIFGSFIGNQIGTIQHISYMQYIAPGLIMMAIITNAYSNVVSSFYGIRFQRSVEELVVAPVPNWLIVLGYTSGGIARGIVVGFSVTLVSLFFTHLTIHHLGIILLSVLLTSILFSLAGFTNAIFARKFDDVSIIPTFVLTPLTYLGGVFYSLGQLTPTWQLISKFNPILYMVNSFRFGILGISDVPIYLSLLIITTVIILLFVYNIFLLKKGIGIKT
jgi:ABC-2 type transport system permease protein